MAVSASSDQVDVLAIAAALALGGAVVLFVAMRVVTFERLLR